MSLATHFKAHKKWYIIIGSIVAVILIYLAYRWYKNKGIYAVQAVNKPDADCFNALLQIVKSDPGSISNDANYAQLIQLATQLFQSQNVDEQYKRYKSGALMQAIVNLYNQKNTMGSKKANSWMSSEGLNKCQLRWTEHLAAQLAVANTK